MTPDTHSAPHAGTILLGPGTAIPVGSYDAGQADDASNGNITQSILHAMRRRWFSIAVLGLFVGIAAAAGAWYGLQAQYTASAAISIPPDDDIIEFGGRRTASSYDLKKRNHLQALEGPVTLQSALRKENVKNLRIFKDLDLVNLEEQEHWLRSQVSASFPGDAQYMQVRVRSPDRSASKTLATELRRSYIENARQREREIVSHNIRALEESLEDHKDTFEREQNNLVNRIVMGLPEPADALDTEKLQAQRDYERTLKKITALDEAIWQAEFGIARLNSASDNSAAQNPTQGEQPIADTAESADSTSLVSDEELERFLDSDKVIQVAEQRIENLEGEIASGSEKYRGDYLDLYVKVLNRKIEETRQSIAERRDEVRAALEQRKREALGSDAPLDPVALARQIAAFQEERDKLQNNLPAKPPVQQADHRILPEETRVVMMQMRLDPLKQVMAEIQRQIDVTKIELKRRSSGQAQVGIQEYGPVAILDRADNRRKLMQSGAIGGVGFLAAAALVVLFDLRRGRLNHTDEVSERLKINVLGTIPLLKGKGSKRLESSQRLAEAVDGVAAALLCRTTGESHRVVMISSAMPGEGKTTLAANLATSLAAAGRRTLLVDFDLRRPMLHKVYQLPIAPGLGELLSGGDVSGAVDFVQETGSENLWLIPAGARRQGALVELASERVAELFEELKEHFEYIVVDGPPVLPVVDTRLVARHADGVVMSMLRDVSELSKVKSACQLLQSYRVALLGAVVIGASGDVYYGYAPSRVSTSA